MDEKTVELRRRLFWEVYTADIFHVGFNLHSCYTLIFFQSVALGRPPSIELSYVDVSFPTCSDDDPDAQCMYLFINRIYYPPADMVCIQTGTGNTNLLETS